MTVRCHFVCSHFPNIRGLSCKYEKCWFWLIKIKHSGLDIIWQISLYLIHALPSKCQFKSEQLEAPASEARIDATAQGIASMLCAHGPEVEWLICTIWEARPSPSQFLRNRLTRNRRGNSTSTPTLSWCLYLALWKVFQYLPRGSPSEACLIRIFVATVEASDEPSQ